MHLIGKLGQLPLGGAREPERAHHPIAVQRSRGEPLGKPPGAIAALHIHLEEPVLGVHIAERERGIEVVVGDNGWDANGIAGDPHRRRDALHRP